MSRGIRACRRGTLCRTGAVTLAVSLVSLGLAAPAAGAPGAPYQRPGVTERVSVASDGTQGSGDSTTSVWSADGRYVAFDSLSFNLVPGDTNGSVDAFVHDRQTGAVERVSVASDGTQGNGDSFPTALSADGRYVAFESYASNLVPGDTAGGVFVHDRATGVTERVSVASDGTEGNGLSRFGAMSADGRHVAFESFASNLVPGDTNGSDDVFVHDRETGVTERVSVASDGAQGERRRPLGDPGSQAAAISADGRYVAFISWADTLVPGDTNEMPDVFVHDRQTGVTERVSVASDGAQQNGPADASPSLSADGRYVAFMSLASNLVPGETHENNCGTTADSGVCEDVYVHDRQTGVTERVSVASDGTQGNGGSFSRRESLSADGRYVSFDSGADNLVPGDTNRSLDVFVHDRATGVTERVSVASDGTQQNGTTSSYVALSSDGRYAAFASSAENLVPGDGNGVSDVFVRDRGPVTGVGAVQAQHALGEVVVSGWATFSGATITSAEDASDDGADTWGTEITGASVVYQPEQEALLLRMRLASLPALYPPSTIRNARRGSGGGVPKVVYRFGFDVDGVRYEVRATRDLSAESPPIEPQFSLDKCAPACEEVASLSGGIGTTGVEVRVGVPLEALGAQEGDTLTAVEASASAPLEGQEAAPWAVAARDEVGLPDAMIPVSRVDLGIAAASAPVAEVDFTTQADLAEGRFSGRLDVSSLPPGAYRVWVRACLGQTCNAQSVKPPS